MGSIVTSLPITAEKFPPGRSIETCLLSQGKPGNSAKTRCAPGGEDLNRVFPGNARGNLCRQLAGEIYSVMGEYEPGWVIDLHEAIEYEKVAIGALGQTLIYPQSSSALDVLNGVLYTLNFSNNEYPFVLRRGAVEGGTIRAAISLGLDGFMVETCLQQPLEKRINHQLIAVSSLLEQNGVTIY